MKQAKVGLTLCSESSVRRPWLNFESGGGWAKRLRGIEWISIGDNVVYRPARDSVQYRDGTMTAPGRTSFEINQKAEYVGIYKLQSQRRMVCE